MDLMKIQDPSFLKTLSIEEMNQLANDIRFFLIDSISKTGGHLSSNLGVVELTIALHYVFNSPEDKIIFDVGHQSYVHKILTGRAKDFDRLRMYEGLSGYQKRTESEHDAWEAGHSSTAIAAVAGFEVAKEISGSNSRNIAVVGDGSLNSGLSFEALNYLGHKNNLAPIIILNDNEMSISRNVGRLAKILNKTRSGKFYNYATKTKRRLPKFIYRMKVRLSNMIRGFANNLTIFDELGFSYYGPIDGHDIKNLIRFLNLVKHKNKPVVLHVITKKGMGYEPAEKDSLGLWHGVGKFDKETGEFLSKNKENYESWSNIFSNYILDYAKDKEDFKVVIPAMITGSAMLEFERRYPEKIIDVGICESFAVCFSSALALNNVKIYLPIYSSFLQRAYDQVLHDLARHNAKIVIGIDRAGVVGADGETHQGIYDIAYLKHIPNIEIVQPSTALEAYSLLNYAFEKADKTVAIRYSRNSVMKYLGEVVPMIDSVSWVMEDNVGKANLIAYGDNFMRMKDYIQAKNLPINLINARFIKPMDVMMLEELLKSELPLYVLEDVTKISGLGSSILEFMSDKGISKVIRIFGLPDEFILQGTQEEIYKLYGLDELTIVNTILK
ncbi:MAG: 1-deoxy-D-xylulose-5-phosphate synthase [Candidatus Izemoplasmatales bacterium]|jgi:1-deoxy-D-xylulose-5-phosphate synthase|nr:1-deoxy-D-xylulose-5-phosphate synthase [Candidatus Izemoplasmatales bacterium]